MHVANNIFANNGVIMTSSVHNSRQIVARYITLYVMDGNTTETCHQQT